MKKTLFMTMDKLYADYVNIVHIIDDRFYSREEIIQMIDVAHIVQDKIKDMNREYPWLTDAYYEFLNNGANWDELDDEIP